MTELLTSNFRAIVTRPDYSKFQVEDAYYAEADRVPAIWGRATSLFAILRSWIKKVAASKKVATGQVRRV